ncbi:TetR/AcrR family transcriptional regulator [Streptomyces boluensis]|uniref:TetR family transcriptional regulator n=1 Tax=Streptomyces boluensis TaxID=1775135 RepID=A0A964XLA9_9ACTN|nr:TetR family transcriptional regulator C-terminal domain-containing protein [Streptomyces boluensis]NBE53125.1 TetR family transcriptional regulator [Streptomyces boluensis]
MPKQVDHEARRREIAQALLRIASTRGLEGASLRDIASEARVSLGQLQHYFKSKDELIAFALRRINELADQRIRGRIEAIGASDPSPRTVLRECLRGMMALDEESRTGYLVGVAYFIRAVHDISQRHLAQEGIASLRAFFADQLSRARDAGEVPGDCDPEAAAMHLICLVEGLNSYIVVDVHTPQQAVALLDRHLDGLFTR